MSLLHCFSCRRSLAWTLSNPSPILGHHIILGTVDVLLHPAHQSHIQLCQNVGLQHDNTQVSFIPLFFVSFRVMPKSNSYAWQSTSSKHLTSSMSINHQLPWRISASSAGPRSRRRLPLHSLQIASASHHHIDVLSYSRLLPHAERVGADVPTPESDEELGW
jgi:hypothetical protein